MLFWLMGWDTCAINVKYIGEMLYFCNVLTTDIYYMLQPAALESNVLHQLEFTRGQKSSNRSQGERYFFLIL